MNDSVKREVEYRCVVCKNNSYQPKTEVDFGQYGKRKISVCGQCLRLAEREKIFDFAFLDIDPLKPFIPLYVMEAVMGKLLDEFRELPQQGAQYD